MIMFVLLSEFVEFIFVQSIVKANTICGPALSKLSLF